MTYPNITPEKLSQYTDFLKIPSISIENKGAQESVSWLKEEFNRLNAHTVEIWDDYGDFPVVMASFTGHTDKTLLIYNHYDVQPIGDLNTWETKPFHPTFKNQHLYCRGASDCKGEIIARLMMIEHFQNNGGLPCNIIFLVEGEEEIGSPHLKNYIEKYQEELKSDICLWECGWKNEKEQIEINCGVKGILSFDLEVETAKQPAHSSLAGLIPNAGWYLTQALSSLKSSDDRVMIEEFYDDVEPLNDYLKDSIEQLDFDPEKFKETFGLKGDLLSEEHQTTLVSEPTFNVSQIQVGGPSSNNSIPSKAAAKIDCRFVPNQNPEKIIELIEQHLKENGFEDMRIKNVHYEAAYRSDLSSPYVTQLMSSVNRVYGEGNYQLIPNFAGGGPMSIFGETLDVPIVAIGSSYFASNVHSPNENIRLKDLEQNVHCLIDWVGQF